MNFGLTLEEACRLHGHRGPWLVLGYRAGLRAREVLRPESEHDLLCVAKVPRKVPYTCALDGIQAATSCTLGKGNIVVEESTTDSIEFLFRDRRSGRVLRLRLRPEVVKLIDEFLRRQGMEAASRFVEEADLCTLFEEELQ